jgi:hypothetical protein
MVQITNYELVNDIESSQVPTIAPVEVGSPTQTNHAINQDYLSGIGAGLKNKLDATNVPTAGDDSGDGYSVGSLWVDITNKRIYQLVDSTLGAAIWKELALTSTSPTFSVPVVISDTTQSTSKDTGCLILEGGLGVEKDAKIGGSVEITGNLTVQGTNTTVNSTVVETVDASILLNKGGNQASADLQDSGFEVSMSDATNCKIGFDSTLTSKFSAGEVGNLKEILTSEHQQTLKNKNIEASTSFVIDQTDSTKRVRFDVSSLSTATTRIIKHLDLPSTLVFIGTKTQINALSRYEGAMYFATDENKFYGDDGVNLISVGSGGGGISIGWNNDGEFAVPKETKYGIDFYSFTKDLDQKLPGIFKIPSSYAAGSPITLRGKIVPDSSGGNVLLTMKSTLIRQGTDLISSTVNQHISTNTTESVVNADQEIAVNWDITENDGQINGISINAGDTILLEVYRGTDTNAGDILFSTSTIEVSL